MLEFFNSSTLFFNRKKVIYIDKIILFNEGTSKVDLIANTNPIAILDDKALDCVIKLNIDSNHMMYLTLDVNLLGDLVNKIPKNGIIKTNAQNEDEYWVIVGIDENLDTVELTCRHWVTETIRSMFIVDVKPRNLNGQATLDHCKSNSEEFKKNKQYTLDLEIESNLSETKSTNIFHKSFYNSVSDLQELWDCEIKKDKFKLSLMDYVGSKTPKYTVEYGKNLISNENQTDINLTIGILAKGFDKLYADNIVYSPKLADNPNILGETISKEYKVRVREEGKDEEEGYIYFDTQAEAKLELERLAMLEFTVNKVDEPIITFNTEFLDLSTVEEHKNDAKVWLNIGDKVATKIPKFNIDIETRIVAMEIDVLLDEVINITLSNNDIKDLKQPTITSISREVKQLPTNNDVLQIAKSESYATVMNGFGGYVHYAPNYTAWMDTDNPKTAKNCLIANNKGWFFSKNGVNPQDDEVTMIADVNGNFSASVLNTGILNANLIKAGILKSFNGTSWINMEDGAFSYGNGSLKYDQNGLSLNDGAVLINKDGIEVTFNNNQGKAKMGKDGFYWQKDSLSKSYHSLTYKGEIFTSPDVQVGNLITLPKEFRGKDFEVIVSPKNVKRDGEYVLYWLNCYYSGKNTSNGTFKVHGNADWRSSTDGTLAGSTGITVTYVVLA